MDDDSRVSNGSRRPAAGGGGGGGTADTPSPSPDNGQFALPRKMALQPPFPSAEATSFEAKFEEMERERQKYKRNDLAEATTTTTTTVVATAAEDDSTASALRLDLESDSRRETRDANEEPRRSLSSSLFSKAPFKREDSSVLLSASTVGALKLPHQRVGSYKASQKILPKEFLHKSNSDPLTRSKRLFGSPSASSLYNPCAKPIQVQNSCNIFKQHRRGPHVSKCMLKLDGYSYVIVASPPDKPTSADSVAAAAAATSAASTATAAAAATVAKNGQLSKQGSLTILRRCSSKVLSGRSSTPSRLFYSDDQILDSIDLDSDNLPSVESPEATEKAALRLRVLLRRLRQGEIPAAALQKNLQYAADVLEAGLVEDTKTDPQPSSHGGAITISLSGDAAGGKGSTLKGLLSNLPRARRRGGEDEDELSEVEPDAVPPEVREWLASTFTKQLQGGRRKNEEKPKFRSVANAIRAGIFVERIYRRLSSATFLQLPPEVSRVLKRVDDWYFDVWVLHEVSSNTPLRCLGYEFLNRYGLLHKFKVPPASLEAFLQQVEAGYCKFKNPYHNNIHAADVLQTIHYMLSQTGLMNWLTDIEVFATLFAALVHDLEHTGTTNNFHVMSGTDTALLYNDRAVLENHHISAAFRLLKGEETNILVNFSREEYREFRTLVIDMVLATDMSSHFQQIKAMKTLLSLPEPTLDKSKALSLTLHCCDISHPSKEWRIHEKWTKNLLEEFFRQGDKERELGLPYSPLCDRNNTLVAESQIGFIEFIVEPSMAVCGDLLDKIADLNSATSTCNSTIAEESTNEPGGPIKRPIRPTNEVRRPWITCLSINKNKWKERAAKDAEERAKLEEEKEEEEEEKEEKKEEEEGENGEASTKD